MIPETDRVSAILTEVAATEVMPRFQALQDHEVSEKRNGELVTVADVAAEQALTRQLLDLLPGSLVVGEEAVHEHPELMQRLGDQGAVWVIDPIDGTGNFAKGRPTFALMIGLLRGGETVAGWIYEPVAERMAVAEWQAGSWLGGRRLSAASPAGLEGMKGTLHASSFAPPEMAAQVSRRRAQLNTLKSHRCAGLEYLRLAAGEMHFSLFTRLMPWDHVPGTLIFEEAGGYARCLDGTPYRAERFREYGLLMAPDPSSWQDLHAALFQA